MKVAVVLGVLVLIPLCLVGFIWLIGIFIKDDYSSLE